MSSSHPCRRAIVAFVVVAAMAWLVPQANAQTYHGRIDVVAEDATGARLPGVTVELTGPLNQTAITDARGEAHFLNLTVGTYEVKANLVGFNDWKNTRVPVAAGVAVPLGIKMAVSGTSETVTVSGEAPVLDTKKQTTAVNVSLEELQNLPTARDPWVVLQSVPGVVMDRVNVGGSESGQQSGFIGKGAGSTDTTYNMDGMPITDMSSLSSVFYYDFDMFQEMNVVTGGSDPKSATGGVQMNLMLKSGGNAFHGGVKTYFENEKLQSDNLPQDLLYLTNPATQKGARTEQFSDYGGELGGPILKDRWWFWGSYGRQDIRILTLNGMHDRTVLPNSSFKTQAQLTRSLRASMTVFTGEKKKWGRNAGPTRPQETTWDQQGIHGANKLYKGEVDWVLGSNLFIVGRYAAVDSGFVFNPEGGMQTEIYQDAGGAWRNSYYYYETNRPQKVLTADANYFRGRHELKFGFSWRKAEVHSLTVWPGSQTQTLFDQGSPTNVTLQVIAPYANDGSAAYASVYGGDTITFKRATVNLGLRYDYQAASVLAAKSASVPGYDKYLPGITAPAIDNALVFKLPQPRVGLTYALDEARKTQLRATYAMFTSQVGSTAASFLSVSQYRYLYYDATVKPGQTIATKSDIVGGIDNLRDWKGFKKSDPTALSSSPNTVGDYTTRRTHELIVGVDRELMPNFALSASYTYRYNDHFNWQPTRKIGGGVITGADYVKLGTLTGTLPTGFDGASGGTYSVPYYGITNAALFPDDKGTVYQSRPGYWQTFHGLEVSANKRLSNRWMARVGFATSSWREFFDGLQSMTNPTPVIMIAGQSSWLNTGYAPNLNGGDVVSSAGGSGKTGVYMTQPRYQLTANGLYQLPFGIDLAASYLVRQGYPMPWSRTVSTTGDLLLQQKQILLVGSFSQDKLPATQSLDLRIGKQLKLGRVSANLDLDIFNLLNSPTILSRQYDAAKTSATTGYTRVLEVMQPRIMRLGMRVAF